MPHLSVLHGDQTGEELLIQALGVLDPAVIGLDLQMKHFDLSLKNRRDTKNQILAEAAQDLLAGGFGIKAATITPDEAGDVGSPNRILREAVSGKVIVRTGRRIPGIAPIAGMNSPVSIVRMAVDDAYGAKEWRESVDGDELAFRTEKLSRSTCKAVAEFAFVHAKRTGARVFGGPKFTVSPIYEGMLKEEMDAAALRHPDVAYEPQLIDATYALLLRHGGDPLVIPTLNRDGDCMSDLVMQLYGSIAGAESILIGFDGDDVKPKVVMTEAPHGTAPALEGKNIANPMAMLLACGAVLSYMDGPEYQRASRAIYESVFESVKNGKRTADLGGHCLTDEFVDAVTELVKSKLEVWSEVGVS